MLVSVKWISRKILIGTLVAIACISSILSVSTAHAATNAVLPTPHPATKTVLPTDPNILYVGRWDTSSSTVHTSYWPGAYFQTKFTGTTVQIKLAVSVNVYVRIDSGVDTFFANAQGTVNLTPTPLAAGVHLLRVAAFTEHDDIALQGLILDAGAITIAPTNPSKLIEFVGDSITAGATDTKRALSDYAWLIGEQLGVKHTQIAQGGICLVDNVPCDIVAGMSKQFFKLQTIYFPNSPAWDFSRYQANAVVINLGTNDAGNHVSSATFQANYITFLHNIRAKYPNARIFVMRTFRGNEAAPTLAAVQAVNAAGDKNVQFVDTTGWLNASDINSGPHPSDEGQAKAANLLGPILGSFLGIPWKPL